MAAKYSKEQLKEMARVALEARDQQDPRYMQLLFGLCFATEMDPMRVEAAIMGLAERGEA